MKLKIDPLLSGFLGFVALGALLFTWAVATPSPVILLAVMAAIAVAMGCLTTYVFRRFGRH